MWFFRSPQIAYGEDALTYLSTINIARAVIVVDRNLMQTQLPAKVVSALPAESKHIFVGDIPEEPTFSQMNRHSDKIRSFAPDWFIALGGGSTIDTAKVLFALYERPDISFYDITPLVHLELRKRSRLIAIPTTSGTGSDCSWAAVVTESGEKRKNELASPEILPDISILDPEMVVSLPPEQTRNTAVDAVTHAVEAHVSTWQNPYSDALAEKSFQMLTGFLPEVIKKPSDLHLRGMVHVAASMAGLAFSNSQIGLAHALGHALGARYHVAHGKAVGLFLPYVVNFNYGVQREKYDWLNRLMPVRHRRARLDESLISFFSEIGQPISLDGMGIDADDYVAGIDGMADMAMESTGITTNPRDADSAQLKEFFRQALEGKA